MKEDPDIGMAIADHAAIALRNAQLYEASRRELAERKRAEEETRRRNQELALLNQAIQTFNSLLDLDQVLAIVLEEVRHLLSAMAISIWLIDSQTRQLVCRKGNGPGSEVMLGFHLPLGQSLAGRVASSGESMVVQATPADKHFLEDMIEAFGLEIASALCVPLRTKRGVIGVIQVLDSHIDHFSSTDARWVQALASAAATAIENAQLYARIRELTAEQERHRLARELHDTVSQTIFSIGMVAQASLKLLQQGDAGHQVQESVQYILELSQTALADIREQLYQLHPTILSDKGLIEALAQHCHMLRTKYLLSVEFVADEEPPLTMFQRETLFSAAREALWNVVRHAGATHVGVSLTTADDQIILSVVDDGVGFESSVLAQGEAMGLGNIEERVKAVNGTFDLQSDALHGTHLTVRIPLPTMRNGESQSH
jgi:signal transduction histidine kinase